MKKEDKHTYICKKDEPVCGLCEVGHQQLDHIEGHLSVLTLGEDSLDIFIGR